MTLQEAARDFLAQERIAIVGASRDSRAPANFVLRKLRAAGHEVFPVNPRALKVEGLMSYPDLRSIPDGVGAVVVFTPPRATAGIVKECAVLGINHVWIHRSLGTGSLSPEALQLDEARSMTLIAGGCPAMFCEPVDVGHRCMRWFLTVTRKIPREVAAAGV